MISIYLCSCNGVRFIKEQLKSIFEQTISPDEVIISDDFSSDGTYEVVQSFIEQNKLKDSWCLIRNEPTLGYPRNFYEGINRCKHEFIFFADQDDIWEPTKLEIMAGQMENSVNINLLACCYDAIDENGDKIHSIMIPRVHTKIEKIRKVNLENVLYRFRWVGMGMVVRKSWALEHINRIASTTIPHDFLFAILASLTESFYETCFIGVHHRRHNNNIAKEEHRIAKLINKDRLLRELNDYVQMLKEVYKVIPDVFEKEKLLISQKEVQLLKRQKYVETKDIKGCLVHACMDLRSTRFFSVIRDILVMHQS